MSVVIDGKRYSWQQMMCDVDWDREHPAHVPVRVVAGRLGDCCVCGLPTDSGIFIRVDPRTVRHPALEDDDE